MTADVDTLDPARLSVPRRLRFLATDSLVYGGALAFNAAFALITFPLLARHFSVPEYGVIDLFTVAASFLTITFVFGQDSAIARFFYEYKDEDQRRQIVSQSLTAQFGAVLIALPILWLVGARLIDVPDQVTNQERLVHLVLLQVPCQVLINYSQNLLKWTFSRTRFLVISIGSVVCRVMLLLGALLWLKLDVYGVFAIVLGVQATFAVVGVVFVRKWLVRPTGFGFTRELFLYAAPYGVIGSISAFVPAVERSVVSSLLGSTELGLYAAGAKVAMLTAMPVQAFQTAWGPFSMAIHKEADAAVTYNWILKAFTLGVCAMVLAVTLAARPAINILASERYAGAAIVVFPMAMGIAIQATGWITEIGIGLSKKSYLSLYGYAVFVSVSAASVYLFGLRMGMFGVAAGMLSGNIAKALYVTYLGQRAHALPWPLKRVGAVIAFTIVTGLAAQLATWSAGAIAGSGVLAVGLLLLGPIGWITLFDRSERGRISESLGRLAGRTMERAMPTHTRAE
jgi:O-antigen/teichoic acid export membrane protein